MVESLRMPLSNTSNLKLESVLDRRNMLSRIILDELASQAASQPIFRQHNVTFGFWQQINAARVFAVFLGGDAHEASLTDRLHSARCDAPGAASMRQSKMRKFGVISDEYMLSSVLTMSKSADTTISNACSGRNTTPFTVLLLMKVIAALLSGLENDEISGSGISTYPLPFWCSNVH